MGVYESILRLCPKEILPKWGVPQYNAGTGTLLVPHYATKCLHMKKTSPDMDMRVCIRMRRLGRQIARTWISCLNVQCERANESNVNAGNILHLHPQSHNLDGG